MFFAIKRIVQMNKSVKGQKAEYDENGLLHINVNVRDDSNFISPFSYGEDSVISGELSEFLGGLVRPIDYKKPIHIEIHSNVIDEKEKIVYAQAIHNHYKQSYIKQQHAIKRDTFLSAIMLFVGVVFLLLMVMFDHFGFSSLFLEVVDIFAWVFLWEAADIFFFERRTAMSYLHRDISFSNAKITFST